MLLSTATTSNDNNQTLTRQLSLSSRKKRVTLSSNRTGPRNAKKKRGPKTADSKNNCATDETIKNNYLNSG